MTRLKTILMKIGHPQRTADREGEPERPERTASRRREMDHPTLGSDLFETETGRRQRELDDLLADGFSPGNAARMMAGEERTRTSSHEPTQRDGGRRGLIPLLTAWRQEWARTC